MSLDIKNLSYVEQDVGQHIKSSKKHFIWEFLLDGRPHKIELYDSRISGKKKLIKDGQIWKEVEGDLAFSKSFEIGKYACTIIQHGEKYELRIDNQSFSHLMDLEKNRIYFSGSNEPVSNTYTSKANNPSTNIAFGMGQINSQTTSGPKPGGLFNFSIKPVVQQKRMSEIPSHEFNINSKMSRDAKFEGDGRNTNNTTNSGRSQTVLLDFNSPQISQSEPTNTKNNNNTFNLLENLDFSSNIETPPQMENNKNFFDMTRYQLFYLAHPLVVILSNRIST
jgi:hypothetical protein